MNPTDFNPRHVEAHYSHPDLAGAILDALAEAGKDIDSLKPEDLASVDEFHVQGRRATLELARRIGLDAGKEVLDVGCGLGGPARYLATEFGCRVTGLDLSEEYCRVAALLARILGLDDRVSCRRGDALAMPFEEASFDVLWTQHAAMNIPDKAGLYREMRRVLKPGGLLAIYDVCAGTGGPVHFPVPWAREPSISFLAEPRKMRAMLEDVGFEIRSWRDTTEEARSWFRGAGDRIRRGASPLGIHLLLGPDFGLMARNQIRNLDENRIAIVEAVVSRPKGSPL